MGSNSSVLLQVDLQEIAAETGFTQNQIKRLYSRFTSMDKDTKGYLTKADFTRIPELHVNPLRDRIIEVLIDDHGSEDKLNFKQFAKVFSTFRRSAGGNSNNKNGDEAEASSEPNSKENKLRFLFNMYDRDKDERINKSELLSILNMLVGANLPEDQMNALAERTIAELQTENEVGQISITFKKFWDSLKKIDIEDKMSMKFLSWTFLFFSFMYFFYFCWSCYCCLVSCHILCQKKYSNQGILYSKSFFFIFFK